MPAGRLELKVVDTHARIARWLDDVAPYLAPDERGPYGIATLYYDGVDRPAYRDKLDGQPVRRKVRVRRYAADEPGTAYVEIRERVERVVRKRRVRGELDELLAALRGNPTTGDPVLEEAATLVKLGNQSPAVVTAYTRRAFAGRYEPDVRVTVDTHVRGAAYHGRIDSRGGRPALSPHLAVLEIKCAGGPPAWACAALNGAGLQLARFSKYCAAVEVVAAP